MVTVSYTHVRMYIATISQHSEPGTNTERVGNLGQSTCIHLITCFIFNVLHLTLQQVTTRIVEEVMMNLTLVMAEMRSSLVKISASKVMTVLWIVQVLASNM